MCTSIYVFVILYNSKYGAKPPIRPYWAEKQLQKKHRSKPPIKAYLVKKQHLDKDDSKSSNELHSLVWWLLFR